MPRGIREMARVTRPGGRVLMNVYGDPRKVQFFHLFVEALKRAAPGFEGPPKDPPPLPFQLQDPERLRRELANAGLKDIVVETITEKLEFQSGTHLWNWLVNSNPISGMLLDELNLTKAETMLVREALDRMVAERSQGNRAAILTNPINIGIGTK
jgi:hypothetical protein